MGAMDDLVILVAYHQERALSLTNTFGERNQELYI